MVIADDAPAIRELLAVLVETGGLGTVVGVAANGIEAVELALELRPDLALLDVEMPRMTGLAAAEVIRDHRPTTDVVLHTGHDDPEVRARAERVGIPLVNKISDADTLAAVIAAYTGGGSVAESKELAAVVLAALERGAQESVTVLDPDGNAVYYDSRAADILGLPYPPQPVSREELIARAVHFDKEGAPLPPEDRPLFQVVRKRTPIDDLIFTRVGPTLVAWRSRAIPILDASGTVVAAAVYWHRESRERHDT